MPNAYHKCAVKEILPIPVIQIYFIGHNANPLGVFRASHEIANCLFIQVWHEGGGVCVRCKPALLMVPLVAYVVARTGEA